MTLKRKRGLFLGLTLLLALVILVVTFGPWPQIRARSAHSEVFKGGPRRADFGPLDGLVAKTPAQNSDNSEGEELRGIKCVINAQVSRNLGYEEAQPTSVPCQLRDSDQEVFLPFKFVRKYFDVYGELKSTAKTETESNHTYFTLSHSYSKVFPSFKEQRYSYNGTFLQFYSFDVEHRARVLCVTASDGVPISTQWDKDGYYYSTQISQYGLAHWSKHVLALNQGLETRRTVLDDGVSHFGDWIGDTTRVLSLSCLHFDRESEISLKSFEGVGPSQVVLGFDLQYKEDVVVTVTLTSKGSPSSYILRYVPEDRFVSKDRNVITYGYGSKLKEGEWKRFTRNLMTDLQNGLNKKTLLAFKAKGPVRIDKLAFSGTGCLTNLTLSDEEHLRMFFSAADWLVKNQDEDKSGWPVSVVFNKDRTKYASAAEIQPGWYSAMAQGHALSVLSRAYGRSRAPKYLKAAERALDLFSLPSESGGFVAKFLNTLTWYEEYPTNPATFVLNGFMYSLLGLFDLSDMLVKTKLAEAEEHEKTFLRTDELLEDGLNSLKAMLPLYDTGSGSTYDLRHYTMAGIEPKVARWDYHATHINQLYVLSTVIEDVEDRDLLLRVAERWRCYMIGKRAQHN